MKLHAVLAALLLVAIAALSVAQAGKTKQELDASASNYSGTSDSQEADVVQAAHVQQEDASESLDASGSLDASESLDGSRSFESSESLDASKSLDASDSQGASESLDNSGSLDASTSQDMSESQDVSQSRDASGSLEASNSQDVEVGDTPAPTVDYLDIADALRTKTPMARPNVTVRPTREDPRATEPPTPEPTYLPTPAPTPAPTPDPGPWVAKWMDHDQVQSFKQPEPVTISERAAVKFKPQLHITNGCHPYPAVSWWGETSGGLKTTGAPSSNCKGSGWGSQVYGRSTWYRGVWAIMYSWYFPKDSPSTGLGHRHDWEHVIVWIDNPDLENPKILAVTPSAHSGYSQQVPPSADCLDGTSVKVQYVSHWPINHALEFTSDGGEFQDLIMWNQLSEDARRALNSVGWGDANTPMNDGNFEPKLGRAWPFG